MQIYKKSYICAMRHTILTTFLSAALMLTVGFCAHAQSQFLILEQDILHYGSAMTDLTSSRAADTISGWDLSDAYIIVVKITNDNQLQRCLDAVSKAGIRKVTWAREFDMSGSAVPTSGPKPDPVPFADADEAPVFQGGDATTFSKWINDNMSYPAIAKENSIQGRVMVQFTIDTDGSVTNVKVLRGVDNSLDKEAVRVVSASPKWEPGKMGGQTVPVIYNVPVFFRLK